MYSNYAFHEHNLSQHIIVLLWKLTFEGGAKSWTFYATSWNTTLIKEKKTQLDEKEIKWMKLPHEVVQLIS